jgi:hypothetical protein
MTPDEFRAAGYRIIDWIADYRRRYRASSRHGEDRAGRDQGDAAGIASATP